MKSRSPEKFMDVSHAKVTDEDDNQSKEHHHEFFFFLNDTEVWLAQG